MKIQKVKGHALSLSCIPAGKTAGRTLLSTLPHKSAPGAHFWGRHESGIGVEWSVGPLGSCGLCLLVMTFWVWTQVLITIVGFTNGMYGLLICEKALVQVNFGGEVIFSLTPLNHNDCGKMSPDHFHRNGRVNYRHMA